MRGGPPIIRYKHLGNPHCFIRNYPSRKTLIGELDLEDVRTIELCEQLKVTRCCHACENSIKVTFVKNTSISKVSETCKI